MLPSAALSQVVFCTVVYNPLDPLERTTTPLVWEHGRTLGDYLVGLPDSVEWSVCVNAEPVVRDEWGDTILAPNDFITLVPEVQRGGGGGGGGGKNVMRVAAMLAVAVLAAYAAPIIAAEVPGAMAMGPMLDGTAGYMTGFGMVAQVAVGGAIPCRGGMVVGGVP